MHEIVLKLKKFLGDTKFNRFIKALRNECQQKERLMYWQEKVLEIFYEEFRIKKLNMEEWTQILPEIVSPPLTSAEIIEDALSEISEKGALIIVSSTTQHSFKFRGTARRAPTQESIPPTNQMDQTMIKAEKGIEGFENLKEIGRNLWKTCDLKSDETYLKLIEPHIDVQIQIKLYEILRTYGVPEIYWREHFKAIFPKTKGLLPKILDKKAFKGQINHHIKSKFKNSNSIPI